MKNSLLPIAFVAIMMTCSPLAHRASAEDATMIGPHPMTETTKNGAGIAATGVIGSVDAAARTIIITHDPIKALHWPKMKMQFQVDGDVDLQALHSGDHVTFTLTPKGEDDYSVSAISKN